MDALFTIDDLSKRLRVSKQGIWQLARIIQGPARDCGGGGRKCRVCRRLVSMAGLSLGAQSARAASIRFWVPMLHFTLSVCRLV